MLIGDMLYGNTGEDMRIRLNSVEEFEKLKSEPNSYWTELISDIMIKSPRVVIMGKPSIELQEKMRQEEEEGTQHQSLAPLSPVPDYPSISPRLSRSIQCLVTLDNLAAER